jgi:ribulose-phosphate 3-epimerase
LQVDGGITPITARDALAAGADCLIAGTAIFGKPDYKKAIADIRAAAPIPAPEYSVSLG